MVHEHHDAPCFDQGVEWSRYGQYQFEMVIVRARTIQFNLKIASLHTRANSGNFSATRATWFVWYTNSMMQLVLAGGLSG